MEKKARSHARLWSLSALLFLLAGCLSQAPTVDETDVPVDDETEVQAEAPVSVAESAKAPVEVPEPPKVIEPEDAPRNVPVPVSTRRPELYAYESAMSPNGWTFEGLDVNADAVADALDLQGSGLTPKKQVIIGPPGDGDPPPVLEPDPDIYAVSITGASTTVVVVKPLCTGSVQLARRVDVPPPVLTQANAVTTKSKIIRDDILFGGRTVVGTFPCGQPYLDQNLEPGTKYCYAVRPTASHAYSAEVCQRTAYEPYKFDALHNSPAASEEMIEKFSWRKTEAVYAGSPTTPTLWYVNILSDYDYDLHALRSLGIHTQTVPLFQEEQAGWTPNNEIVESDGKLLGQWLYALIPGSVYNDMRVQMQEQLAAGHVPSFQAVVFREVPVAEARMWGTGGGAPSPLQLDYVGKMGVVYNGISACQVVDGVRLCTTSSELVGWLIRKVYDYVTDFVDNVVEGVRQLIGAVARLIKGDVTLTLRFKLMNTDPGFGTSNEVMSAWRNAPLLLRNTRVQLSQGLALFKGDTDGAGVARIKVAKGWSGKICLELENQRISFTSGWAESTACVGTFASTQGDRTIDVPVSHSLVNAFATMTDASEYVHTVMGYGMPRVKVLVGWAAEHSGGEEGQSFAPCLGMAPVLLSGLLDLGLGTLLPVVGVGAALAEAFYSVDIILKEDGHPKRGVATHEYGHTVMCAMMRSASLGSADTALLDILSGYKGGDRKDPAKQQTYMTEALADFLTLQVVGGTNYVRPSTGNSTTAGDVAFCHAGSDCYETNLHVAADDWDGQLRRTVSILQDAFDDVSANTSTMNDGSHWRRVSNVLVPDVRVDSNRNDDPFELVGSDMRQIYERWADRGGTLREASFFGGLGELMMERGHSHRDVCDLFAAHDANGACPDYIVNLESFCPPFDPANVRDGFCRPGCCSIGEGDCNSDSECAPGLRCQQDNGALFGLAATVDLCTQDETLSVSISKPSGTALSVSSDKGGIACSLGTCSTTLQHNETVLLTASRSVTWTGCTTRLSATQCRVQMDGARSVRATIEAPPPPPDDDDDLPPVCKTKPYLPQCNP